jgi:transcriptional regulator with XRE-family HTH domain
MKPIISEWLRQAIADIAAANGKELQQVETEIAGHLGVTKATVQAWKTDYRNPTPEHLFRLIYVINELHPSPSTKPIVEMLISWGVPLDLNYELDAQSIALAQQIETLADDEKLFLRRYLRLEPIQRADVTGGLTDLVRVFFGND